MDGAQIGHPVFVQVEQFYLILYQSWLEQNHICPRIWPAEKFIDTKSHGDYLHRTLKLALNISKRRIKSKVSTKLATNYVLRSENIEIYLRRQDPESESPFTCALRPLGAALKAPSLILTGTQPLTKAQWLSSMYLHHQHRTLLRCQAC